MSSSQSYLPANQGDKTTGKTPVTVPDGKAVASLSNLIDVLIPSPTDGQVLTFVASAGKWEAVTPVTGPTGDSSWTAVSYVNSWTDFGTPYGAGAFRKDANSFVHLRGVVAGGSVGFTAFALPVGYRPLTAREFVSSDGDVNIGSVQVNANGNVVINGTAASTKALLDGITFLAEQ